MDKKQIQIAGYSITQLTETEYEAENKEQGLDFYFDRGNPAAVEIFVFDSKIPTEGGQDSCIAVFYAAELEEAIHQAMALQRESLQQNDRQYNIVQKLRDIANSLEVEPNADSKTILFPGWDEDFKEEKGQLVKEATRAIIAVGTEPDQGIYVSLKAVAALLRYIADMME